MQNLLYTEEFASKMFVGNTMKDAYLKAVKWYASAVLAKDELRSVYCSYEKVHDAQLPTIVIHLFVSMIEEEVRQAHCSICRETHNSFFMSEETNCEWCKLKAYQKRCDQKMLVKKQRYIEILGVNRSGGID